MSERCPGELGYGEFVQELASAIPDHPLNSSVSSERTWCKNPSPTTNWLNWNWARTTAQRSDL